MAHGTSSGQRSGRWWAGGQVHPAPPPSAISCLERDITGVILKIALSKPGNFLHYTSNLNFFFFFKDSFTRSDGIIIFLFLHGRFQYFHSSLCKTKRAKKTFKKNSSETLERGGELDFAQRCRSVWQHPSCRTKWSQRVIQLSQSAFLQIELWCFKNENKIDEE